MLASHGRENAGQVFGVEWRQHHLAAVYPGADFARTDSGLKQLRLARNEEGLYLQAFFINYMVEETLEDLVVPMLHYGVHLIDH